MAQYGWENCPEPIKHQVNEFVGTVSRCSGDNLIGAYLHGSLAMGCFNPERSDLDLLYVVNEGLSPQAKHDLARLCLEWSAQPVPMELSFVRQAVLHPWQYPTPYEFHFAEGWRKRFNDDLSSGAWQDWPDGETLTDPDLAAHVTITRLRGIRLLGQPLEAVFPEVPRDDYVDSLMRDVDFALEGMAENPVYAVLNFCRIYWYLVEGRVASKDEAGVWALDHLPEEHCAVVYQALQVYRGSAPVMTCDAASLTHFADNLHHTIQQLAQG
jgi:streptomycin 3"-adenylyltransferase